MCGILHKGKTRAPSLPGGSARTASRTLIPVFHARGTGKMTTLGTPIGRAWRGMAAAVLLAGAGAALANDVPATLAGVTLVSAEQARKLAEAGTPMIDTRVG